MSDGYAMLRPLVESWHVVRGRVWWKHRRPRCQRWGDEPREPQEICPACGHYGLHHYVYDRCYACGGWPQPMRPSDQAAS